MYKQKPFWIFLLAFLAALPFTATNGNADDGQDKTKVVTTFTVIADMARNVAGDAATVVSITTPGAEIHDYEPTPQDIVKAQDADLILHNGLNLERWFKKFLRDVKDVPSAVVTNGIEPISIYEGPYSGKPNPHAWMSTSDALIYIENIKNALIDIDPGNKDVYTQNAEQYSAEVKEIQSTLKERLADIPEDKRWLVTSEGAFSYLARDLGFKEAYLWPINADQQGTPQQVKKVIDTVKEHNIPVVFSETTVSSRPAEQVADETDAMYGGALYVDSLSEADGPVPTYLSLLKMTTDIIASAFEDALQQSESE